MFAMFVLAILQFCLGLGRHDITTAFEGRVAATAQEMLHRHDWIVPYCNGVPRVVKPPLPYWAVMSAWSLGGTVDVALARLPSAFLGALAIVLVMDLTRRTAGRRAGLFAGLVWLSTWFIVDEYRKAMADPYLAFFTLLSVWLWVVAEKAAHRRIKTRHKRGLAHALFILCYVSAGVAALAKGHLIVIHLLLALGSYQLVRRRWPRAAIAHAVGIVLLLVIALPWYGYMLHHVPGTWQQWGGDAYGENATAGAKTTAIYQYVANLPLIAAPWSVFALIGALMPIVAKRKSDRLALWPLVWLGATVLVFTCVPMKKNAYLLPAAVAMTMLAAFAIASATRRRQGDLRSAADDWLVVAHLVAAAIGAVIVLVFAFEHQPYSPALIASASACVLALALSLNRRARSPALLIVSAGFLFALSVHVVDAHLIPDSDNRRSDAPFARKVDAMVGSAPLDLVGSGLREDVLFYLDRVTPHFDAFDRLPGDYRGYILVTDDQLAATSASPRATKLLESAPRPEKDKLALFRIGPER